MPTGYHCSGKKGNPATGSGEFSAQKFDELLYLCIIVIDGYGTYAYFASMGDLVAIVDHAIYRISRGVIKRPDLCCKGRIERVQKLIYFIDLKKE